MFYYDDLSFWLTALSFAVGVVMESWTQIAFRYRNDDGSESGASWLYALNTDGNMTLDTTYRMRIGVQASHSGGSGSFELTTPTFEYNKNSTGWYTVTTASSNVRAVASADTSWTITDGDATTEQLAQSKTFVAGQMDENGTSSSITLADTEESEWELVFQIRSAEASAGDTIQLRITENGIALDTYTATPSITAASGASGALMGALAGEGGLAGPGGLASEGGGLCV